ncbi:MAG: RIP metalloprotease RseP [Burkholderiaceae bacterium]|nr:RIP metalloprotease RseP [Burkholderiaceae bacterium]
MTFIQTLFSFLVALTLLIFVHELGHYLVARWCGVKVLRFSIGFGRPLISWHVGADRTEWVVAAIPLGGYVRMLDEREPSSLPIPEQDLPRAFSRQSLARRSAIVAAGPIANFLLAIALYLSLNLIGVIEPAAVVGQPPAASAAASAGLVDGDRIVTIDGRELRSWNELRLRMIDPVIERRAAQLEIDRGGARRTVAVHTAALPPGEIERDFLRSLGLELAGGRVLVASVLPESAALRAGLRSGDEVVAAAGTGLTRASELIEIIRAHPAKPLVLDIRRGSDDLRIEVIPDAKASERAEDAGRMIGRIGASISHRVETVEVRYGGLEALARATRQTWDMSVFSLRMLGKMFTGELSWRNLSGPVSIADYAGQSARVGWFAYVSFLALISISLGVLNLLPIPVLDGGHLVYYALEALRGRPLSERVVELTQKAGLAMIAAMMVLALFNDLTRLIGS